MAGQILGSLCQVSVCLDNKGRKQVTMVMMVLLGIRCNHSATQSRSSVYMCVYVCVCVCVCMCVFLLRQN